MTTTDELAAVRAALSDLERAVSDLRQRAGSSLGMRRLDTDVRRVREDLDEIGPIEIKPAAAARAWSATGLQAYPQTEDEHVLHRDSDDEGIGGWRPHPLAAPPQ
jgi:hypothetical protein